MGSISYKLKFPLKLDQIHYVLHVSILRTYRSDPTQIVQVEKIELGPDLTFEEKPVQILDREVKLQRKKSITLVKVLWRNNS